MGASKGAKKRDKSQRTTRTRKEPGRVGPTASR